MAVYASSGVVTIYDAGVARPKTSSGLQTYFISNYGGLAFGASASTLYVSSEAIGSYVYSLTVDATGITASQQLSSSGSGRTLQYDNGRLYFPVGVAADAATGAALGQFSTSASYPTATVAAVGPIFSDSTLNRAWIVYSNYGNSGQILSFDETTFNPVSSLPVTGIGANTGLPGSPADLIRWGQTGLAFHVGGQVYILQGPIVKDVSSLPADLQITAQAASAATTGTALSYQFQVKNLGPNPASGATATFSLPASVIPGAVTASQGSCAGSGVYFCDLGALANGASATISFSATPTLAGSIETTATVASTSYDAISANNQVTAATTVTGALYSAVPAVTGVSPNLIAAGGSTTTLTVNGSGFSTASSVLWNGAALPTVFVSANQVTATVDASLIAQLGWAEVSVSSAAPGGGKSGGRTVSIYDLLSVPANAIAYDPFTRRLYAALPSTSTAITGNSLVAIDPTSGAVGQPVLVGSEPNLLSETSDGNYMFVGLSGAKSLGRFNLLAQALDLTVPLTTNESYSPGPAAAFSMATVPGSDSTLAIEIDSFDGIGIFDISGSTGAFRKNSGFGYSGDNPVFTDSTHFYAYDAYTTGAEFYRYAVNANGVTQIDGTTLLGSGGFGGRLAVDGGLVYFSGGGIANPSTTPPTQVGVLPLGAGEGGSSLYGGGAIPYAAEAKSFNVGINAAGTAMTFLERFDTQHFVLEDTVQLPSSEIGSGVNGTRWGQDGLAYILPAQLGSTSTSQVFLMRGPFVLPAEAAANPAPALSAVGSGTIAAGGGNQYVAVTGTGFLPGASVLWGGTVHDTIFADAQHLQFALGAAELKTAAGVSVTIRNPGSTDSNAVTVAVQ